MDPALPSAPLPQTGLLTIFPEFDIVKDPARPVPPLSARQKFEIAYHKICSPSLLADALADSAFQQATNTGPAYGQGWGAFGNASVTTPRIHHQGSFFCGDCAGGLSPGPAILSLGWVRLPNACAGSCAARCCLQRPRKLDAQLRQPARLWRLRCAQQRLHARAQCFIW